MIRSQAMRRAASAITSHHHHHHHHQHHHWTCCVARLNRRRQYSQNNPDHRKLGTQQQLFLTSTFSPGSPIFLPDGARIFNRLVDFLRKKYVQYGFDEVITPTIYKKSLWATSGHLENYADDMYTVTSNKKKPPAELSHQACGSTSTSSDGDAACCRDEDDNDYGLKPMNCPGHCLIFASKLRSYRDLPIRFADFGALHRDEVSGALSGLTRTRRFHQDDGHIFCRPSQVEEEITKTLEFVRAVYSTLRFNDAYRLVLSTRPEDHFIGTEDEWQRAQDQLQRALEASGMPWSINHGDGAFYGPKIDIIFQDSDGKNHQTATVQLDFQLPKRFELEYQAPAPEYEARGETTYDPDLLASYGLVRPVMIHRAIFGSVERLMALLIEKHNGKWPFWLNPKQVIILTLNSTAHMVDWAVEVRKVLVGLSPATDMGPGAQQSDRHVVAVSGQTSLTVDIDSTARTLGAKIRDAHNTGYGQILVVGEKDVLNKQVSLKREQLKPGEARDRFLHMVNNFE